jgi:hypothetical protein
VGFLSQCPSQQASVLQLLGRWDTQMETLALELNPLIWSQLIFNKNAKNTHEKRIVLSINGAMKTV